MTKCKACNGTGKQKTPVKAYVDRLNLVINSLTTPWNRYTYESMPLRPKITTKTHVDQTLGIIFRYYRGIKQAILGDETVNIEPYLDKLRNNGYEIKNLYSVDGVGLVLEVRDTTQ